MRLAKMAYGLVSCIAASSKEDSLPPRKSWNVRWTSNPRCFLDPSLSKLMTIHYHGTPITPHTAFYQLAGRHFCVSFARADNVKIAHDLGQTVMLDNGAFSVWRRGATSDWPGFYAWCDKWLDYPTTWAIIPDVIVG